MIALGAFLAGDGIHYASSFASVPRLTFAVPYMAGLIVLDISLALSGAFMLALKRRPGLAKVREARRVRLLRHIRRRHRPAGASAGEIPWGTVIGCVTDAYVFRAVVERGRVR